MKKFLLIIFFLFLIPVNAQELTEQQLDSLYSTFLRMQGISTDMQQDQSGTKPEVIKCGLGIISQIKFYLERYSFEKQQLLKSLLQRPTKQSSMVSPSGFFRIHYNTTGTEVPRYNLSLSTEQNVMEVGIALDSSYSFEINFLGYPQPPQDDGGGGDNLYDVYISNLGGVYGFTERETPLGNGKHTSFIVIDNDYLGFPSTGFAGMRVTVAHEFHHAIQMGNYIYRFEDIYFFEITSTSMEEFVYDDVNDYYYYMSNYFNDPGKPFASFGSGTADGYDLAIWNIYLKDEFGFDIIKRQWEMMPQMRALEAIVTTLNDSGASFGSKLNDFGIWTFFTNYRTIPGNYFDEAANYPVIEPTGTFVFNSMPVNGEASPTSNNFITFINSTDTLTTIISNSDYVSGINNLNGSFPYEYILSGDSISGSTRLTDNYFAKLNVSQPSFWSLAEILNNQVIRQDSTIFAINPGEDLYAYPNPFFYNKSYSNFCDCIEILIDPKNETEAHLNIYTSAMELVYESSPSLQVENNSFGRKVLRWYIRDIPGEKLASGVYIYAIRLGDETSKGKMVIFNE